MLPLCSLSSSECSSECYRSRLAYHCPDNAQILRNQGLRTKLLKSENRRCALAGSLRGVERTLQHQRDYLQKQETEILDSKEALENLLQKQEFLASKVSQLQNEKLGQKPIGWQSTGREDNQRERITALEEKFKDISHKIDSSALSRKTSGASLATNSADAGNDYTEEDAESLSEQSRGQVEELLYKHLLLKENCQLRENQITSVIIELKNLRKAYYGMICHLNDPQDIDAISWINRIQLIKKSLEILQSHQQKIKLLEKENKQLKVQLQYEALKQQFKEEMLKGEMKAKCM
ncbi:uncharacterized protein LOC115091824 isoform X2 [Rhinatrema bivittatum]|uniref:uncharacterized protein LOC115091824 isoform X2 n=1 Tax=Rhinatrema bivittatum TaxID=194408 RepID=UPI00112D8D92|nr:uncharacterized protein LOC115091824 isoform X2 [Rhinatrema bivittatum]